MVDRITIEDLPVTVLPSLQHIVPAMKDGLSVRLTVEQILSFLVSTSPADLNTLAKIATSIGNNPAFATSMAAALALKANADAVLPLAGGVMSGPIERMMGESIRTMLINSSIANNAADAANDIDFSAQTVASDDAALPRLFTIPAMTKRLDANWAAGNNQGGRDVGAIADGTWHCFAILNPTTYAADYIFSQSATAPTLPTGFTHKRRIAPIIRDGGSIIGFIQDGDYFGYKARSNAWSASNPGTAAVLRAPGVPTGIRVKAKISASITDNAGVIYVAITDPSTPDAAASSNNHDLVTSVVSGFTLQSMIIEQFTNTSGQLRTRCSTSTANTAFSAVTHGFFDARGRG